MCYHCSLRAFRRAGERDIEQILEDFIDATYAIDEGAERLVGTKRISKGRELKLQKSGGRVISIAKPTSAIIIAQ